MLVPSPTYWIRSFSLLVLLLHSHLYLLFFMIWLVPLGLLPISWVKDYLEEHVLFPVPVTMGKIVHLWWMQVLSTIAKWCNQLRSQSKYNGEENQVKYTIDTPWLWRIVKSSYLEENELGLEIIVLHKINQSHKNRYDILFSYMKSRFLEGGS